MFFNPEPDDPSNSENVVLKNTTLIANIIIVSDCIEGCYILLYKKHLILALFLMMGFSIEF